MSIGIWTLCSASYAQSADRYAIRDQYIVQFKSEVDGARFFSAYPDIYIKECLSKNMNIWLVQSATPDLLSKLNTSPSVKVAQYNHGPVVHRGLIPDDSLFGQQWNMLNTTTPGADISATKAWQLNHSNVTRNGDSIVIAVVDGGGVDGNPGVLTGGFDIYHPDLNFFINHQEIPYNGIDDDSNGYVDDYKGWDVFTQSDSVYNTSEVHATHVSGIAGAIGNNTIGVAGVSWGVKIMPIIGAIGTESDVVKAYDYVVEMRKLYDRTHGAKGAFVVATNSSFGVGEYGANPDSFPIWCAMYDTLGHYGILSAVAVPDYAVNVDQVNDVPAGCPSRYKISVTNTTNKDGLNTQAGYGPRTIDIGAPGSTIMSCYPVKDGSYGYDEGTSMSCPHLSGAVAAMLANACPALLQAYFANPDSISLLIKDYIFQSVDPLSDLLNITGTGGRLNLYHAFLAENTYNCNNCSYPTNLTQQKLRCYGDTSASITISAGTNSSVYHYLWSTGDTTQSLIHLGPGYYQVTVTDSAGCQRQLATLVAQPEPLSVSFVIIPIGSGSSGNIIVNATAGHDTIYYAIDSGSYQTGAIFATTVAGLHTIYVKTQTGCVYDTILDVKSTVGMEDMNASTFIQLAPNPLSGIGRLTIRSSTEMNADLILNDLTGRMISSKSIRLTGNTQQTSIDMSSFSEGVYILSLRSEGETLAEIKVVK